MAAPTLTPNQLSAYLTHISLPKKYHPTPTSKPTLDLSLLTALHIHTISTIPYDNLSLHYSPTHKISISPHDAFAKVVTANRGRGGYCMENSILFNAVLRGLGFHDAYMAGVRIRLRENGVPTGSYIGIVHLVNIVTLPSTGEKYMLDVGFGGDAPTCPIPLVENHVSVNIGAQENRLVRAWLPGQRLRTEATKQWVYEYRNGKDKEWNAFYAFGEVEALEADFEVANWFTGSSPMSFQTFTCLVILFLRREKVGGEEGEQEIYGKRMLVGGTVKENLGGRTRVVVECGSEEERVTALREWFGMEFTEEEKAGIRGWGTELKGQ